jgi:hypothetical protein
MRPKISRNRVCVARWRQKQSSREAANTRLSMKHVTNPPPTVDDQVRMAVRSAKVSRNMTSFPRCRSGSGRENAFVQESLRPRWPPIPILGRGVCPDLVPYQGPVEEVDTVPSWQYDLPLA